MARFIATVAETRTCTRKRARLFVICGGARNAEINLADRRCMSDSGPGCGRSKALRGGLFVPSDCGRKVFLDTWPHLITEAEIVFSRCFAFLRCLAIPLHGSCIILGHTRAPRVHRPQLVLGIGGPLVRQLCGTTMPPLCRLSLCCDLRSTFCPKRYSASAVARLRPRHTLPPVRTATRRNQWGGLTRRCAPHIGRRKCRPGIRSSRHRCPGLCSCS